MTAPQQRPYPPYRVPRPGPVDDLIRKHRELMRVIWERHAAEVQHPQRRAA